MSIEIKQKLTPREKARKSAEAISWLIEQGELTPNEEANELILRARARLEDLSTMLSQTGSIQSQGIVQEIEELLIRIKL